MISKGSYFRPVLGIFLAVFSVFFGNFYLLDKRARESTVDYERARKATTIAEREEALNSSFKLYQDLLYDYPVRSGNGFLYGAIADNAFQLALYPYALQYSEQALRLAPSSAAIKAQRDEVFRAVGALPPPVAKLSQVSLPRLWQLFAALSLLTFCICSLYLSRPKRWRIVGCQLCVVGLISLFSIIAYRSWFSAPVVIVVKPAVVYRDVSRKHPWDVLLRPGDEVSLIGIVDDLSIEILFSEERKVGFVGAASIAPLFN